MGAQYHNGHWYGGGQDIDIQSDPTATSFDPNKVPTGGTCQSILNSNFVIIQNVQFTFVNSNISNEINVSDIDARLATAKLILAFNKNGSAPMIIGLNALKTKVALFSTNVASVGGTITVNLLLIM